MGVLNVTPDSFSDGGLYLGERAALAHGRELIAEGAAIVDVGGESTRPGAQPVPAAEELARVVPAVEGLADLQAGVQISIDTSKSSVAAGALAAGATLVNDVSALRADPDMVGLVAQAGCDCCLVHMRGDPRTMQGEAHYEDVVDDVRAFLESRLAFAVREGISEQRILLDPGIGFGKALPHNLELLARLDELAAIGPPLVIGTSRKSFLARIAAEASHGQPPPPGARLAGTIASNVLAFERGATVFRVHEVAPVRDALAVAAATLGRTWTTSSAKTPTT